MRDRDDQTVRLTRRGLGFAASGPGFYVWDLEPRAVVESACELGDGRTGPQPMRPRPATPTRRGRVRRVLP